VKKPRNSFYPPEALTMFRRAVRRWLGMTSRRDRALGRWARDIAADEDAMSALFELVCWHDVAAENVLEFLAELRMLHVPERELRAYLRKLGAGWKQIETLARQVINESEPYLGDQRQRALEVHNTARFLSRFFLRPKAKRPLETEIADCKESIVCFLKRRDIREVNQYGWILLKAVFGELWTAGNGRDQIEAFRQIPSPFRGKILTRTDAEKVIEKAKVDLFRMEQAAKKSVAS
jgi:hypothetical protein